MIAKIIDKTTIEVYDLTQFDPSAIMHSGQIFRYFTQDDGFLVISGKHWAKVGWPTEICVITCDDSGYFYNFFDLETDYSVIKEELAKFSVLSKAIKRAGGIRILRGDFFEIAISFIISSNNNIKRFTKTLNALAKKFGTLLECGEHAFPSMDELSAATADDFYKLGCGYRAPKLVNAIWEFAHVDPFALAIHPSPSFVKHLTQYSGVGPKVASCIALFAFARLDVAPIDTWIRKALDKLEKVDAEQIFSHKYAGVAQQYIFYHTQHMREDFCAD